MLRKFLLLALLAIPLALSWEPVSANPGENSEPADEADPEQRQFVRALDAAWIRVLQNDDNSDDIPNYRDILNDPTYASDITGLLPKEHVTNIADCLPEPEVIPFPAKPEGLLERVIETGQVTACRVSGDGNPAPPPSEFDTTNFFKTSGAFEAAIWETLAAHYGTGPITVNAFWVGPPFDLTTPLNNGDCDYMATGNALGGASFNLSNFQRERRRDVRLHTCTISASGQFIHIPDGSGIVINDVDDLIAQPHLRICTGNLSTQLVTQYFGNVDPVLYPDRVFTQRFLDIAFCTKRVLDGDADIIVLSLPDLDATGATWPTFLPPHLRPTWTAVDTKITAGTPYWIATQKPE
jgi:hypothetical protein